MLRFIVVLCLISTVVQGFGLFSVLLSPKSLEFTGDDKLESAYVGDVLLAALGNAVAGSSKWTGMSVRDPFSLAQTTIIVILVRGVLNMTTPQGAGSYELKGIGVEDSLNYMVSQLPKETVNDINFTNHKEGMRKFKECFGTLDAPVVQPVQILRPKQYWSHKHFLDQLGLIKLATQKLDIVLKPSHVLIFRMSLDGIVKVARYAPISEAKALLATIIANLLNVIRERNESVLLVQVTLGQKTQLLTKSQTREKISKSPFEKMNDNVDHPILANIIIWFSVIFALVITIICYAIATIDPGRDSIIYRVSTVKDWTKKKH
ncbi:ATPase H(+)-transporting accessory protein 2-like [Drosophila nasuta]|uniref:ATPase H(+)-transporting accessory protein 2-like n=1 Tax=Drosophila nasuta TaxID=42062 RepID=UPI00295EC2CD|nr:ATPase H(+)-transporting accessory protein 2-like [Drosophila nasuta]